VDNFLKALDYVAARHLTIEASRQPGVSRRHNRPLCHNEISPMGFRILITLLIGTVLIDAQTLEDDFQVYTEHPRLFLNARRLRLLRRERERTSIRWIQFETLMAGRAQMTEPGFAAALYYQVSGRDSSGRQAVDWALGAGRDLRQLALVFDWCQPLLSEGQSKALAQKLRAGMTQAEKATDVSSIRNRVLAAIALAGHEGDPSKAVLSTIVEKWWRGQIVPAIKAGKRPIAREDGYALMELLHAIRDNTNIELRDPLGKYFKELPAYRLLTYYPSSYPAAENEYRIPIYDSEGEPDVRIAALSRAADLALVAYDTNALENQFVQGWLIHDRFLMRGAFGMPYEFMWANPYQPGLSYYHLPLTFHDPAAGRLLLRSSWEDDAEWISYANGRAHLFLEGTRRDVNLKGTNELHIGTTPVRIGRPSMQFTLNNEAPETTYIIALKPNQAYEIEVDDQELEERTSDAGGILPLKFPPSNNVGVRMRETPPRPKQP
jgi:hypothetical protein